MKVPYAVASLAAHVSEGWARLIRRSTAPILSRAGLAILTQDVRHDPARAERDLGWRSQVELIEGVDRTVSWLRQRYPDLLSIGR